MSWLFFWRKRKRNEGSKFDSRATYTNKPRKTFALASLFRRNNIQGFKIYKQEELTPEIDPYAQVNNSNKVINLPASANFLDAGDGATYQHQNPPPVIPRKPRKKRTVFTSFAQSFSRFRSNAPAKSTPRTGQVRDRIRRLQNGNDMNNRKDVKDPLRFNTDTGRENQSSHLAPQNRDVVRKNYSGVPMPKQPHWKLKNANVSKASSFAAPQKPSYSTPNQPSWQVQKSSSWSTSQPKKPVDSSQSTFQPKPVNASNYKYSTVAQKQANYEKQHNQANLPTIFKNDPYAKTTSTPSNTTTNAWKPPLPKKPIGTPSDRRFDDKSGNTSVGNGSSSFNRDDNNLSTPMISASYQKPRRKTGNGTTPPSFTKPSWQQNNNSKWNNPVNTSNSFKKEDTNLSSPMVSASYQKPKRKTGNGTAVSGFNSKPSWQTSNSTWNKPTSPPTRQPPKWKRKTGQPEQTERRRTDNTFTPSYNLPSNAVSQPPPIPARRPIVKNVPSHKVDAPNQIVLHNRENNLRESIKGLKNLAGFWNQVGESNRKKQELNPFSSHFNGKREVATGNILGSKSEERAKQAQEWTNKEIDKVVQVIKDYGQYDTNSRMTMITFGELFLIYENISDTLVFMLLKARKRNRIAFDGGEMLLQGRDDHVQIFVRD